MEVGNEAVSGVVEVYFIGLHEALVCGVLITTWTI